MIRCRRFVRLRLMAACLGLAVAATVSAAGRDSIKSQDLAEWLSYIASDDLKGRAVFTAGLGLAAAYIEDHLRAWGVEPAGDKGSFLQTVRVLDVKSANRSTLTVEVAGQTRTFAGGDGIVFPKNVGAKRRFTVERVHFAGYGLDVPAANHEDFRGLDVKGAAVVWLGPSGPKGVGSQAYRRLLAGRNRYAIDQMHAAAAIGQAAPPGGGAGGRGGGAGAAEPEGQPSTGRGRGDARALPPGDFTSVQRLDAPIPPSVTASDAFFEFLFSRAPIRYGELKRLADRREGLERFVLDGVKLTFNLDAEYEVVRTELTQNVVGVVPGSDPQLRNTYVAFGAHYDHVGYAEGEIAQGRRIGAPGRVAEGALDDRIWNGADDNGSGTVSLMAVARAFAEGPRPRRSLLLVWHAGEERGLYGSRYFADYPSVPLDRIVALLNIDMVGRNRDNKPTESDTVYPVGSDRISSELHLILEAANQGSPAPLTLDYEMNDPSDPEQLYYRSDHYSYAAKGIPIIFFTTGLHPDYHANTDEVSRIELGKMARIAQLVYDTGAAVANLDHPPARDNKGPRAGR